MRIALGLQYNGALFSGWQSQPHRNTVQDALERALAAFARTSVSTITAGRTDAGVHAVERCYDYVLYIHRVRVPLLAGRAGWIHAPLDIDAMRVAARALIGIHDFS